MKSDFPSIAGIPFRHALVIDNKPEEIKDLTKNLKERGMSVTLVEGSTTAISVLHKRPEVDLIVLDWLLNEQDSNEAEMIMMELEENIFAPLIIYTDESIDKPEAEIRKRNLDRIAIPLNKTDVNGDVVFDKIKEWFEKNPELKIFLEWACRVEKSVARSLWEIYTLEVGGLRAIMELLAHPEDVSHVPLEQEIINLFEKILSRNINNEPEFFKYISGCIEDLIKSSKDIEVDADQLIKFHRFERYKPSMVKPIWTGDILRGDKGDYYVIVTPRCDLCNPKKPIENILLLQAEPFQMFREKKKPNKDFVRDCIKNKILALHFLPYAADLTDGLLCRFDHMITLNIEELKRRIREGEMEHIQTIDSPFIENLIQRMNAYLMRLGVREIGKLEIDKILTDIKET